MDIMDLIFQRWQGIVALLFATGLVALFYYKNRKAIGLWWLGVKHRNFAFGKIRNLAKNPTMNGEWFHVEKQVCQEYKPFYANTAKDKNYYIACKEYLNLAGESGRKPLTPIVILGLFIVLVLEAWGFSYTMAGFIDIAASENTRKIMAVLVAVTFALALAFITHNMGAEIYRNKLIDNIRELWSADANPEKTLTQQAGEYVGTIQSPSDVNEKSYIRRLNRLKLGSSTKTYKSTITAIIGIIIIACILTYVRVKSLETTQTEDAMCNVSSFSQAGGSSDEPDFSNLYGGDNDMPNVVKQQNAQVVANGANEKCEATKEGSWATFGMLAILFMILQGFSTWVSISRGFAGAHSDEAYKRTYRHQTSEEFQIFYENEAAEIADAAQRTLSRLQTQMANVLPQITPSAEVNELIKNAGKRTFYRFIEEQDQAPAPRPTVKAAPKQESVQQTVVEEQKTVTNSTSIDPNISDDELFSGPYTDEQIMEVLKARKALEKKKQEAEERKKRLMAQANETPEERMVRLTKLSEQPE